MNSVNQNNSEWGGGETMLNQITECQRDKDRKKILLYALDPQGIIEDCIKNRYQGKFVVISMEDTTVIVMSQATLEHIQIYDEVCVWLKEQGVSEKEMFRAGAYFRIENDKVIIFGDAVTLGVVTEDVKTFKERYCDEEITALKKIIQELIEEWMQNI